MIDYKLIGNRIKEKRKANRMTQEKLAEYLGVSVGYISQLERGITKISLDTLSKIADHFGSDVAEFISMSNLGNTDRAKQNFMEVYNALDIEEREMVFRLLCTYQEQKNKKTSGKI